MSTHDQPHRSERFPSSTPEPDTELAPPLRRTPPGQEYRNPPDSSRGNNWTPVSVVVATLSTFHQWFTHVRLLGSHLTHHVRLFRNAHHPGSFTDAACGGLRPPPAWAVPEGLPPSPVQHRIQSIPSTSEPPSAFLAHHRLRSVRTRLLGTPGSARYRGHSAETNWRATGRSDRLVASLASCR